MENEITRLNRPGSVVLNGESTPGTKPGRHGLNALVYAIIFIVVATIISYAVGVLIVPGSINLKPALIPACSYALLGIFFTGFLYRRLSFLRKANYNDSIMYAFMVCVGVFMASLLISFVKENGSVITSLFYSGVFIMPYTIYQNWLIYSRLSFTLHSKKVWYFPKHSSTKPKATVFLNSIHIKIKMAPLDGTDEQLFETTVPGRISVGSMFNDFIDQQESTGSWEGTYDDVSIQHFGWQFFTPSFLGMSDRPIDADLSLDENKIKNNMVVIARRVPQQLAIASPNQKQLN